MHYYYCYLYTPTAICALLMYVHPYYYNYTATIVGTNLHCLYTPSYLCTPTASAYTFPWIFLPSRCYLYITVYNALPLLPIH